MHVSVTSRTVRPSLRDCKSIKIIRRRRLGGEIEIITRYHQANNQWAMVTGF